VINHADEILTLLAPWQTVAAAALKRKEKKISPLIISFIPRSNREHIDSAKFHACFFTCSIKIKH
jgi:hypothetical protein